MKAKFTGEHSNAKNFGREKETVEDKNVTVIHKGELKNPISIRWYMGRSNKASVVYCSIWIHGENFYTSGHGSAGGGGYCKTSAAACDAISSAGIELYGSSHLGHGQTEDLTKRCYIGGVGDSAVNTALEAIVRAMGYRGKMIIV